MHKIKSKKIVKLLAELSKDPIVKSAVEQLKTSYSSGTQEKIGNFKELLLVVLRISSKFVGKKKARVLEETLDALGVLIQISLLIKTNAFDRPEVRSFFHQLWKGVQVNWLAIYNSSKRHVDLQIEKLK